MAEDSKVSRRSGTQQEVRPLSGQGALTLASAAHPALPNHLAIPALYDHLHPCWQGCFYRANTALAGWQAEGTGFKLQFATDYYGPWQGLALRCASAGHLQDGAATAALCLSDMSGSCPGPFLPWVPSQPGPPPASSPAAHPAQIATLTTWEGSCQALCCQISCDPL